MYLKHYVVGALLVLAGAMFYSYPAKATIVQVEVAECPKIATVVTRVVKNFQLQQSQQKQLSYIKAQRHLSVAARDILGDLVYTIYAAAGDDLVFMWKLDPLFAGNVMLEECIKARGVWEITDREKI